jgi:hypothetical protein
MNDEVVIITPELAPGAGGVADYTLRLVEEWGDRVAPRFVLPNDIERNLRDKLPSSGGKILLQYSAYGFNRLGYPRRLLRTLTDWKKTTGGLLVVMFHEIWAFWPLLNKNRFVQRMHRADIGRLLREAPGSRHRLHQHSESGRASAEIGSTMQRSIDAGRF